jgi:hypothetical protein
MKPNNPHCPICESNYDKSSESDNPDIKVCEYCRGELEFANDVEIALIKMFCKN